MSKKLEDQARKFNYNLKRFQEAMSAYETRLNSIQIAKTRKEQAKENGGLQEQIGQWNNIIDNNEKASETELRTAIEAFGELKKSLK